MKKLSVNLKKLGLSLKKIRKLVGYHEWPIKGQRIGSYEVRNIIPDARSTIIENRETIRDLKERNCDLRKLIKKLKPFERGQ